MAATTPIWVPLIVAVVGVLGTLGASVFTQIHSARREQATWERERERRHDEQRREEVRYWLEERRRVYSAFLASVREYHGALWEAVAHMERTGERLDLTEPREGLNDQFADIDLVASDEARHRAALIWSKFTIADQLELHGVATAEDVKHVMRNPDWAYDYFLSYVRYELGTERPTEDEAEPVRRRYFEERQAIEERRMQMMAKASGQEADPLSTAPEGVPGGDDPARQRGSR